MQSLIIPLYLLNYPLLSLSIFEPWIFFFNDNLWLGSPPILEAILKILPEGLKYHKSGCRSEHSEQQCIKSSSSSHQGIFC